MCLRTGQYLGPGCASTRWAASRATDSAGACRVPPYRSGPLLKRMRSHRTSWGNVERHAQSNLGYTQDHSSIHGLMALDLMGDVAAHCASEDLRKIRCAQPTRHCLAARVPCGAQEHPGWSEWNRSRLAFPCGAGSARHSASARSRRRRNRELAADRAGSPGRDFAMPRHGRAQVRGRVVPDGVVGALAQHPTAVSEVALEVVALQAAAMSIVSCSTWPPPIGGSRPSSR